MPDEIDRDQEFNEQRLEEMIELSRYKPTATPSLHYCHFCGKPIPEKRRQMLPGVATCTVCQEKIELGKRKK